MPTEYRLTEIIENYLSGVTISNNWVTGASYITYRDPKDEEIERLKARIAELEEVLKEEI